MSEKIKCDAIKSRFCCRALERRRHKERSPSFRAHTPKMMKCFGKTKPISLWNRQVNRINQSKSSGYCLNCQSLMKEQSREKEMVGPAYYDVDVNILKKSYMSEGKAFTTTQRPDITMKSDNPPPGTYFPNILQRSFVLKKHFGNKPTFAKAYRWKQTLPRTLSPTRYRPQYSSIDSLLKKVVSTRGPYDLFTGARDETTIKNHFGVSKPHGSDRAGFIPQADIDFLLKHPSRKYCGVIYRDRIYKQPQICRKSHEHLKCCVLDKNSPGPCSYNITTHIIKPQPRAKVAFNTSVNRLPPIRNCNPGPGRYNVEKREGERMPSARRRRMLVTPVAQIELIPSKHRSMLSSLVKEYSAVPILIQEELERERKEDEEDEKTAAISARMGRSYQETVRRLRDSGPCENTNKVMNIWEVHANPLEPAPWRLILAPIERILYQHPAVKDVLIVGTPDSVLPKEPFIFVTVDAKSNVTEKELLDRINFGRHSKDKIHGGLRVIKQSGGHLYFKQSALQNPRRSIN